MRLTAATSAEKDFIYLFYGFHSCLYIHTHTWMIEWLMNDVLRGEMNKQRGNVPSTIIWLSSGILRTSIYWNLITFVFFYFLLSLWKYKFLCLYFFEQSNDDLNGVLFENLLISYKFLSLVFFFVFIFLYNYVSQQHFNCPNKLQFLSLIFFFFDFYTNIQKNVNMGSQNKYYYIFLFLPWKTYFHINFSWWFVFEKISPFTVVDPKRIFPSKIWL